METKLIIRGRLITPSDILFIRDAIELHWTKGRSCISQYLCEKWEWRQPNGNLKDVACRELLRRLEQKGYIILPARKKPGPQVNRRAKAINLEIDTTIVEGKLQDFQPIEFCMVRGTKHEKLFQYLIDKYHYLGYRQIVGAHLKYIAFYKNRPLACLGWGAAAWRVHCRDQYIGWSKEQRLNNLHLIVNNTRFLLLPWVHLPCLGSFLLGKQNRILMSDWQKYYGYQVALLETFVHKEKFKGTVYRAANWVHLGETKGRGKWDRNKRYNKPVKSVFVYPLHNNFRQILRHE